MASPSSSSLLLILGNFDPSGVRALPGLQAETKVATILGD
jgi:hypothetical protein